MKNFRAALKSAVSHARKGVTKWMEAGVIGALEYSSLEEYKYDIEALLREQGYKEGSLKNIRGFLLNIWRLYNNYNLQNLEELLEEIVSHSESFGMALKFISKLHALVKKGVEVNDFKALERATFEPREGSKHSSTRVKGGKPTPRPERGYEATTEVAIAMSVEEIATLIVKIQERLPSLSDKIRATVAEDIYKIAVEIGVI